MHHPDRLPHRMKQIWLLPRQEEPALEAALGPDGRSQMAPKVRKSRARLARSCAAQHSGMLRARLQFLLRTTERRSLFDSQEKQS